MTDVNLQTLNQYILPDLGIVTLNPALTTGNNPPDLDMPPPSVMASFALVASTTYRWKYNDVRHLKMGYVLERNGLYEAGEFNVVSKAVYQVALDPTTYTPAPLYLNQTVLLQADGSLGVSFSVITDSLSVSEPQFGLAYKITNALPAEYPTLRVYLIKLLPTEG